MESAYSEQYKEKIAGLVLQWETQLNGQDSPYLHTQYLDKEYSYDGNFSSIDIDDTVVMAGVLDEDSPIAPINQKPVTFTTGIIPKIGAELKYTERQMSKLNVLKLSPDANKREIFKTIFTPTKDVYRATKERLEFMFKQGLSTGKIVIDKDNNVGHGVLVDLGYKAENQISASAAIWGTATATPITDLRRLVDLADRDSKSITTFFMTQASYLQMMNSDEAKALIYPTAANSKAMPVVSKALFDATFMGEFDAKIQIVKNNQQLLKNGVRTTVEAWKAGQVVAVTEDKIGALVHSRLAEQEDPVDGIAYQEAEGFIMLSHYKVARPAYGVFNNAQSRALTVIKNNVYKLDTTVKG